MGRAPKGNANALKHGLYAKHFKPEEKVELRQMAWNDLLYEILGSRSMAEKAMELANREMAVPAPDVAKVVALINTWTSAVTSISLAAARYGVLTGENANLNDSLAEALAGLPLHEPDPVDKLEPDPEGRRWQQLKAW
jgi:hypothetical protein